MIVIAECMRCGHRETVDVEPENDSPYIQYRYPNVKPWIRQCIQNGMAFSCDKCEQEDE